MATQLPGLDGHHFSLRSILKNPSTVLPAELAGLQSISLTGEMNLQPAALSWSSTEVDAATEPPTYAYGTELHLQYRKVCDLTSVQLQAFNTLRSKSFE